MRSLCLALLAVAAAAAVADPAGAAADENALGLVVEHVARAAAAAAAGKPSHGEVEAAVAALRRELEAGAAGRVDANDFAQTVSSLKNDMAEVEADNSSTRYQLDAVRAALAEGNSAAAASSAAENGRLHATLEAQMQRLGVHDARLQELADGLGERVSEKEVREMVGALATGLRAQLGNSDALTVLIESLKMEVRCCCCCDDRCCCAYRSTRRGCHPLLHHAAPLRLPARLPH